MPGSKAAEKLQLSVAAIRAAEAGNQLKIIGWDEFDKDTRMMGRSSTHA